MGLTRGDVLRGSFALAAGGGLLAPGGALLAPGAAFGADDEDLALVRLGIATELLGDAFYRRAIASGRFPRAERDGLRRAAAHERAHYNALAPIVGPTASAPDDFDFRFPRGSFRTRHAAALLGVRLQTIFVGVYLGAVAALHDAELRELAARLAASQAAHLAFLRSLAGEPAAWIAFPNELDVVQASAALGPFGA